MATADAGRVWMVAQDGQQYGPYTQEEVRQYVQAGNLKPTAQVWREGMQQWQPVATLLGGAAPVAHQPTMQHPAAHQHAAPQQQAGGYQQPGAYQQPQQQWQQPVGYQNPHTRSGRSGRGPWRFASAGALALVLLLMPLPWLRIQCAGEDVASQSGLQTMWGGNSPEGMMKEMADEAEKKGGGGGSSKSGMTVTKSGDSEDDIGAAPLMIVFGLLVVAGIVLGFASPRATLVLPILAGTALLVLAAQLAIGFPVEKKIKEANDKQAAMKKSTPSPGSSGDPFGGSGSPFGGSSSSSGPMLGGDMTMAVKYTPWLWIALLALVAAAGLAVAERMVRPPPKPGVA